MLREFDCRTGRVLVVSPKRHTRLAAIVAVLWSLSYGAQSANSISGIHGRHGPDGRWFLDFDYTFDGERGSATFRAEVPPLPGTDPAKFQSALTEVWPPEHGAHHSWTEFKYPGEGSSGQIIVTMLDSAGKTLATG